MSHDLPFTCEYAKSGRASCKGCKGNIPQGALRIGIMIQSPHFDGKIPNWHHEGCFWKKGRIKTIGDLHNFDALRWEDQEALKKKIADEASGVSGALKNPACDDFSIEYSKSSRAACKQCQSKIMKGEIRVSVKDYESKAGKMRGGVEAWRHLNCFAENLEELEFSGEPAEISGFTSLSEDDQKLVKQRIAPVKKRKATDEPSQNGTELKGEEVPAKKQKLTKKESKEEDKLKEQSKALWDIKDKLAKQVFKKDMTEILVLNGQDVPVGESNITDCLADIMLFGPLKRCKECDGGQLVYSSAENAYKCTGDISAFTKCQFKTQDPERKAAFKIPDDYQHDYLSNFNFKPGNKRIFPSNRPAPTTKKEEKIEKEKETKTAKSELKKSVFTKSVPTSQKLTLKGGAAVDPQCEMADSCHVYKDKKGNLYTETLNLVDIQRGSNSYYKLQLLEHDKEKSFYVFRAWGRIGTTVGGNKCESFGSSYEEARDHFKELYLDKTGNQYKTRKNAQKKPGKFYPVEVDYGEDETKSKKSKVVEGSKSKLPLAVQEIVKLIFDVEQMKQTMKEFEIDLKKMPLGKLSKKQIHDAYKVLGDLQKSMKDGQSSETQILDASNKFYTMIPHDFGMQKPKMLDNDEIIKEKTEMLDSLLEIEVAYSILQTDSGDEEKDPLDEHYEKLKTDLMVLEKETAEFKRLVEYVNNTHGKTHSAYKLNVQDILKVEREGEKEVFKPLHNRMLLWHGSRVSNYAGILSQGLRIAPPEAPMTGYMFGKGIYFADMVTKSANYCHATPMNTTGLMMLCEVALGNMWEQKHAKYVEKLPADKHSTKGIGMNVPNPKGSYLTEDGLIIPMGKGTEDKKAGQTSLLYNEYIVYDAAQVRIKYLLKMDFKYKTGYY